jgi:hypothetical protein
MKTYNKNPEAVSLLTPEQCRVTQEDGTERPFQNEYWDNNERKHSGDAISLVQVCGTRCDVRSLLRPKSTPADPTGPLRETNRLPVNQRAALFRPTTDTQSSGSTREEEPHDVRWS